MSTLSSKERNILDLAKNLQDDLHVYCKGAAGSGDNFYARTFANLADRADELVKLLESAPETSEPQPCPIPEANGFSIQGKEIGPGIWGIGNVSWRIGNVSWHPESGDWRGMADINGALCVVTLKVTAQKAVDQRAIDANALADAHRMYEAEHGHPFSESEGAGE